MKILMFTPYLPYPLASGGQIRSYNLIKNLSSKHEITLFSFIRTDERNDYKKQLLKFCKKVRVFRRARAWYSLSKILLTGFSPFPYLVAMYYFLSVKETIKKEINKEKYDLIHVETYYLMPNLPETSIPILLAEQTIEYLVYQHFTETFKFWPLKPLLYIDVAKHKFWEKHYWKKAKIVVAMSKADRNLMLKLAPQLNVKIVPNGVDIDFFEKWKNKRKEKLKEQIILFVGNFNWLQNREAVLILAKKVFPQIRKEINNVRLWIVGKSPTQIIRELKDKDIFVDEGIEDIREAYNKADVLVAPIYGGGGTRYKILEAMASGLPVITTPTGIEGLGVSDGKEALIRKEDKQLAQAAIMILKNNRLAKNLTIKAKDLVREKYNWKDISKKLNQIYQEIGEKYR